MPVLLPAAVALLLVARVRPVAAALERRGTLRQATYSVAHDVAGVSRARTDAAVDSVIALLRRHRGELVGDVVSGASVVATGWARRAPGAGGRRPSAGVRHGAARLRARVAGAA